MLIRFVFVCLLVISVDALAADSTAASDPAPNKPTARQVVAPKITATRAVRNPDGSLSFICIDRPNPKATQLLQKARSTHALPDQQ